MRGRTCYRLAIFGLVALASMASAVPARAITEDRASRTDLAMRKLGRGVSNIVTAPGELIRMPTLVGREEGGLAAMSVGLSKGLWRGIQREAVGLFEVVTFYSEIPGGFKTIMEPEFIWKDGDWVK